MYVTKYIVCVQGHDPLTSFFPVILSLFWLGGSFMALIILSVKTCMPGLPCPIPPSVPAEAGHHLVWAAE